VACRARKHGWAQSLERVRHAVSSAIRDEGAAPPPYGGEKSDIDQPPLDSLIQTASGSGYPRNAYLPSGSVGNIFPDEPEMPRESIVDGTIQPSPRYGR